jgi:hypothetical protein
MQITAKGRDLLSRLFHEADKAGRWPAQPGNALPRICVLRGYEVLGVYRDDISGSSVTRTGMDALQKFLKANRTKGYITIIDALDRFARDIRGHWDLRDLLAQAGGKIESRPSSSAMMRTSIFRENLMPRLRSTSARRMQSKNQPHEARAQNGYWVRARRSLSLSARRRPRQNACP